MYILRKLVTAQGLLLVQLLSHTSTVVNSDCHVCKPRNMVACYNETAFSMCINGVPTHNYIVCPKDFVCTDKSNICYPRRTTLPICAPPTGSSTTLMTTTQSTAVDDTTSETSSCGPARHSESAWTSTLATGATTSTAALRIQYVA